ncbi:MAG TPA: sigma-54-dependent Fis family transcriptional regulator [Bacteroidetes bacterium]|nr:sigma-54-dependent Fis family transcriptional regulator [Bacteroidota bacterium]
MKATVLIVEDEEDVRWALKETLSKKGYQVRTAATGEEGLDLARKEVLDLVLLDVRLPGMNGIEVLRHLKEEDPDLPVIMITAHEEAQPAIQAMKMGAFDYFIKTVDLDVLLLAIEKALETNRLKREVARLKAEQQSEAKMELFGVSKAMEEIRELIRIVAATPRTSVLIQGESGTGKELVANAIHAMSLRADRPLVKINCAAIPENLLESELFGYERGAFTDAKKAKKGLFELADGGTLFLDEISSMRLSLQPKLLRVLETGTFRRIGGTADVQVDVRIVAASNTDLGQRVREGEFREDLYYRLKVMEINIPPLRERREDIIPLAKLFLERLNKEFGKNIRGLSERTEKLLLGYHWPGNVRELRNVMERATILCQGALIEPEHLPLELRTSASLDVATSPESGDEDESLAAMERRHILRVLEKSQGNKSLAARRLNISRSTLREKLRQYGLQ